MELASSLFFISSTESVHYTYVAQFVVITAAAAAAAAAGDSDDDQQTASSQILKWRTRIKEQKIVVWSPRIMCLIL